ncbi:MAG TPA: hypothetical protein VFN20_06025, partial [Candidatus Acidoferrum sp.]|nr:hypothetical protein [Candidatus Acidoferrum sp.]
MKMRVAVVAGALALVSVCVAGQTTKQADRVFVNGKIWTGDSARPMAEALAIRGDKIVAVGTAEEVK